MPDEVKDLRRASDSPDSAKEVLAQVDASFAESLTPDELKQLGARLK
jgi:hypothetical protein